MTFISYAQNFEDVMLWRALKHVENGFYIDVGANDPEEDSVTKAFYDRGWHGINIEPVPEYYKRLSDQRPHDINLAMAAGASDGELTLFDIPCVRGWASPNEIIADNYRKEGFDVEVLTVPARTLTSICEEYATGEIHFLKIDVEGHEGEVIRGMNFGIWRPWVLVIEAIQPNSQISIHEQWEKVFIEQGYSFVYFDGLNRYYVADEHKEIEGELKVQPNVLDGFVTAAQAKALEAYSKLEERAQQTENQLAAVYASVSWRFTRPLRAVSLLLQRFKSKFH